MPFTGGHGVGSHRGGPAGGPVVQFAALGPVQALVAGRTVDLGAPKQRALLALLVSQAGRTVTTDVILEALWEGSPPPSAMTSVQAYVAKLRKVLEPGRAPRTQARVLRTCGQGYVLDAGPAQVDVHRFAAHAEAGRRARERGEPRLALGEFDAGLALWRGQPFVEVSGVECVVPEVARLEEVRHSVVEMRCAALLATGAHDVAVAELRAFVQANPLREYACELLGLALYRAGRQADALQALRTIQASLSEELGVDPTVRLQQLRQQILTQDPALDWHPAPAHHAPTHAAPATAVAPFDPAVPSAAAPSLVVPPAPAPVAPSAVDFAGSGADADGGEVFVGREAVVRQLTEALAAAEAGRGQVVAVSGEPGVGKTAVLRRFAERSGVPVLWGTCPERIGASGLSLWEQVLRAADAAFPHRPAPAVVSRWVDAGAGAGLPDAELFDAVGAHVSVLSRSGALVVMLDHVHRADPDSLRMLVHLGRRVPESRLVLIVSYRSDEAGALAGTWAAMAGAGVRPARLEVGGLTVRDVQVLAGALVGSEVGSDTAQGLCARSGGNPALLREMIKLLAGERRPEGAGAVPVAASVREVVGHRVERLPGPAAELLAVAAVAGRHFDVEVVAEVASIEIDTALAVLDSAIAAGLVDEDKQRLGWFRFTDALVAQALYETTGRMRRGRLHLRIEAAAGRAWASRPPAPTAPAPTAPAPVVLAPAVVSEGL